MALWNNTDVVGSRPHFIQKRIDLNTLRPGTHVLFIDNTEADVASNKSKGLKYPGWWLFRERIDSDGVLRHDAECIAALSTPNSVSGDATDNLQAPNVNTVLAITTQPANQTAAAGAATFSVVATATPTLAGAPTFQWLVRSATGALANVWAVVPGATAASLALTGLTAAVHNGNQYKVVIGGGGRRIVSNPATLTVS